MVSQQQHSSQVQFGHSLGDFDSLHSFGVQLQSAQLMDMIMTLEGKNNHFNVKFLKGYGHSISVKDSKITLKSNHDPFNPPEQEEWFVKNMPYEKIVLSGKGYVSTEALSLLSQNNRILFEFIVPSLVSINLCLNPDRQ